MSENNPPTNVSRRTIIKGAAVVTATAAAMSGAAAVASPATAAGSCATDGSLIGSGMSLLATSTFNPPVTATPGLYTLHAEATFAPALVTTNPTLLLNRSRLDGTSVAACTGSVTDFTLNGTLHWSDGTTSTWHVDELTIEVVAGHAVGRNRGTISNGHFAGAQVDRLTLRLGDQLTACFTGGGVSSATGAEIIVLTQP